MLIRLAHLRGCRTGLACLWTRVSIGNAHFRASSTSCVHVLRFSLPTILRPTGFIWIHQRLVTSNFLRCHFQETPSTCKSVLCLCACTFSVLLQLADVHLFGFSLRGKFAKVFPPHLLPEHGAWPINKCFFESFFCVIYMCIFICVFLFLYLYL